MPDILGCCGAGGSDAVVLRNESTSANRVDSGTPCSGGSDAVVLGSESTSANRVESGTPCSGRNDAVVDGSKQVESFAEQTIDGSFMFPGSTIFVRGKPRFHLKGHNKFNGKKPGLDNGYAPGHSCEKKPLPSHCTCLPKKHEASSSDSSGIEHHMPPIPQGFTTKQGKAGRVKSWAIINFSDIDAFQSVRFSCEIVEACAEIQMDIEEMPLRNIYLDCALPDGIEDSLRDEYKFINTGVPRGKRLGFLIIILPKVRDFDEKVEAVCKDLGVIYHCCFPRDIMNLNKQYLNNTACEIKAKVLERNNCCDYCKNIGLDGNSMEFCVLDEEYDDHAFDSDEDMAFDIDSDEVCGFESIFEGDDDFEQADELGENDIEAPFEHFLCSDKCGHLIKVGWGSHVEYKNPYSIPLDEYSKLFDKNGNYKMSNKHDKDMNVASTVEGAVIEHKAEATHDIPDTLVVNGNSAEYHTLEESGERTDLDLVEVEREITIHWACIIYSTILDRKELFRFFSKLQAVSVANGMHFNSIPIKIELVGSAITAGTLSQTWSDLCNSASKVFTRNGIKGAQIEFLLIILPERRDFDEEIEKFHNDLGVVHQFCLPKTVRIPESRHLKKFARQIKFKVSKRAMVIPFVSEAPTILFGADITHCAPEEGSRSVASVVASLDWPKVSKYGALVASQPHHEVIIRDLFNEYGGMVSNLIESFIWRTEEIPQRMIFFRHGITEGQESHMCQQEIHAIKQDCALLGFVPNLTYVVATQRLNMEFEGSSNMTKKRLRVQQDTSYPTKFEVLCDHGPFEGTNMVVHYRVVHDDNNLTAQELESIIIRLSLIRDFQVYPEISMIPPAHFARLAALYYQRQAEAYDSRKSEGRCDVALPSPGGGLVIKPYWR